MQKVENLLEGILTKNPDAIRSERALLLSDFIKLINEERIGTKYPPVNPKFIAIKTAHLKLNDLRWFFQECSRYKKEKKGSFSKCFYGSLKIKK